MTDRERAIDRVRKLRALTEARGATPAEAELACQRARRLIAKHSIRAEELLSRPAVPAAPAQPPPPSMPLWQWVAQYGPTTTNSSGQARVFKDGYTIIVDFS